jgi:GTP pyrophosphokinase
VQLDQPESVMAVHWGDARRSTFPVSINIQAYERRGLIRDLSSLLDNEQVNILQLTTVTDKKTNLVDMALILEVENFRKLSRLLEAINQIPNVYQSRRQN